MWYHEKVFYQIYTLNFCGAPFDNDGHIVHRITRINDFVDYFKELGIGGIYFNPIFSSDHHGYDTRDYRVLDERLGTNEDFKEVCQNLHLFLNVHQFYNNLLYHNHDDHLKIQD